MASHEEYERRFEELLKPVAESFDVDIYDVEFVKDGTDWCMRGYIDKEGGVTINDCEAVSRKMSDILDEEDFIEEAYCLEISSPGLGRKLKKDKHLEKSIGEAVELKTFKAIDKKKDFEGILKAFDKNTITIMTENNEEQTFDRAALAIIRLKIDF